MGGIEGIGELVIGIAVVLFVLAPVWATVVVGLIQIVREKARQKHSHSEPSPLPTGNGERVC
jgi:archaellin